MSFAHNFRPGELAAHYQKHCLEFGPLSQKGYQFQARSFLNRNAGNVLMHECFRNTLWGTLAGDRVRFDVTTQEFGIVTRQGYIRTYFIPDPAQHGYGSNLDYFLSQC